ncbi:MAG: hypothetical protein UV73_C0016G0010 [Candidatus Gottesmanbacteria bacterium GW2011_GWA2_43_14]|uniref:SIMPL domain-containing protein n=1 Tax=Candidatus Gottesmanbacteria bacterium GW2011_GWA2_43_14 TaxID=1618443 RepID=A0A0G1DCY0_9BACT|nr:MAG: hypothetical protein UV73_C0016G0010 [Candidatus Gottesmanbacteria bacterium GW2011_GWA2_43_14]
MNLPKKILKYSIVIIALILIVWGYFQLSNPLEITVTGTGTVSAPADSAKFIITLSDSYPDASTAATAITANTDAIRNYLEREGVAPENIIENEIKTIPGIAFNESTLGVRADKTLIVSLTDLSKITSLTSKLYSFGAKLISDPDYVVSDKSVWEKEAEKEALKDAEIKANYEMKKYRKFFKRISGISQSQSVSTADSFNPVTGQILNPFQNQEIDESSQNISKTFTVTFNLW